MVAAVVVDVNVKLSNNERFDAAADVDVDDGSGGGIVGADDVVVLGLLKLFCVWVFVGIVGANGGGRVGA